MTTQRDRSALLAAATAVLMWSTVATGFKLGLQSFAPLQLLLAGAMISAIVFAIAATIGGRWVLSKRMLIQASAFGLLNPALYYVVLFEAYARLPAQIAQPLNYTWAIVLAVLAVPLLKQPLSTRVLAGIVLSYLGVLILLSQDRVGELPRIDWTGVGLALASTVIWAVYWLLNARSKAPPESLMALSFIIATPVIGVACALGPGLPEMNIKLIGFGAWVGLLEMGLAFLLWQRALRLTSSAARVGQLIFLAPFLSLALIATVLGEPIHTSSIVGLTIIVGGVLLTRTG